MEAVRQRRAELDVDPTYHGRDTKDVARLKQDELELTRKVFQRIDPTRDLTSDFTVGGHDIDPYWNPFHKVDRLQKQVTAEFDEYARYVSVAEARRARIQIRKAIKRSQKAYNPYSEEFRKWHGRESGFDQLPKPFRIPDKYWERSPLQAKLEMEKITFRDVDIIQHFLADNGYILPRRTTMLSRLQQARLVKAVRTAQKMSLIPYTWRTPDYQAMPLMDPLQWMADRLTDRVITDGNLRARAMLQIMVERYPELNFRNFLAHEAAQKEKDASPA